jgi:hypothetical protein
MWGDRSSENEGSQRELFISDYPKERASVADEEPVMNISGGPTTTAHVYGSHSSRIFLDSPGWMGFKLLCPGDAHNFILESTCPTFLQVISDNAYEHFDFPTV